MPMEGQFTSDVVGHKEEDIHGHLRQTRVSNDTIEYIWPVDTSRVVQYIY